MTSQEKEIILKAENIHKSFSSPAPVQILSGVNLIVEAQTSIAIMGRSGEGKTTLLHILGTLENFDLGSLTICGTPVHALNAARLRNEKIGFIFQSYNLLEDFTTLENVLMPGKIGRKKTAKGGANYQYGMELLQQVGLENRAHFPAKVLSGGEKQRAAIARALYNDPDIILADEPSGNLDHASSDVIHQLLLDVVHRRKKTLILVTHEEELAKSCDKKYLLSRGNLLIEKKS